MNRTWGTLVGVVLLLLAATNVWAQATAQINGTVADSSGAVLPGVTVVAIQTDTGFRREGVTDGTRCISRCSTCRSGRIVSKRRSPGSAATCRRASCCRSTATR